MTKIYKEPADGSRGLVGTGLLIFFFLMGLVWIISGACLRPNALLELFMFLITISANPIVVLCVVIELGLAFIPLRPRRMTREEYEQLVDELDSQIAALEDENNSLINARIVEADRTAKV